MNTNTASVLNLLVSKRSPESRKRLIDMIDEDKGRILAEALAAVVNGESTEGMDKRAVDAAKGLYETSFAYNPKKKYAGPTILEKIVD